ncbi:hypothetical protein DV495_004245 [Geotrichum candidum]|uniref:Similar to Saccharomyces cerevisiae YBR281C DUG2 Probable di-and tri-peptidase n=1 Tax=Geotrichum candidum TaxID=1173061 RepID=A0A0J9XGA9_GEOCN|nr:hypothetical protein DV452_002573 [Geotrichum candidum]KAI9211594.1 hypothetical protein DS838_003536 [Geotrichum bryndzae]KAF5121684.1 hypothetical protein DV495_004245 [Geotrichum candidum]KAF7497558.1 hypothetical protein DV113_004400 [Geotrichum candidum]KAI8132369.1 hypothetical protein DUD61_003960 [Geotrichum candidum]
MPFATGIENDGCHQSCFNQKTDFFSPQAATSPSTAPDGLSTLSISPPLFYSTTSNNLLNSSTSSGDFRNIASSDSTASSTETLSTDDDDYWPVHDIPIKQPQLLHSWNTSHSVLSLAATSAWIIAGTGSGDIILFNKTTFEKDHVLSGHSGSVYSLAITPDEQFLFSGSADSLVKAWDLSTRKELYTIYSVYDIGDVFSVVWAPNNEYLILGSQNASIQWIKLYDKESYNTTKDPSGLPSVRFDRFFDSTGPGGRLAPQQAARHKLVASGKCKNNNIALLEIPPKNVIQYAHFGYVYSLLIIQRQNYAHNTEEEYLVSGGGDGTVKIWNFDEMDSIHALYTLDTDSSVFSMCCQDSFLYCGLTAGQVCMFDLDTRQIIRVDQIGKDDVMSMSLYGECLFRSANGIIHKWDSKRYHRGEWQAHNGLVLASTLTELNGKSILITGANDSVVSIWDVSTVVNKHKAYRDPQSAYASFNSTQNIRILQRLLSEQSKLAQPQEQLQQNLPQVATFTVDHMIQTLTDFVAYKTISGHEGMYVNDCRRCATFLRNLFKHFGAESQLIPVEGGKNPIVFARFSGNKNRINSKNILTSPTLAATAAAENASTSDPVSQILFYGHYDVITAENTDEWSTDPFNLTNMDGYMYGRGVSDNKGPILAAIFAVAELVQQSQLENDVVFLIEGEEESGSVGFQEAIESNRDLIGNIDWVLLSNSYWLDDETPCLNYGLRGVIKARIEIQGDYPDLHSGVYGGVYREPTIDLVNLLSKLASDQGEIKLPEFHQSVRPVTDDELKLYKAIERQKIRVGAEGTNVSKSTYIDELMSRWRYPSLTVHGINVSGPGNSTVIPKTATATISLRIVPNQDMNTIKKSLESYLHQHFNSFASKNNLKVSIFHEAEPWVGDPTNQAFQVLATALRAEWHVDPLFIREGGSIPVVPFLEKTFGAPAAQLPCGQASDGAHLDNERLRIVNFIKARNVFRRTFKQLGKSAIQHGH